MQKSYWVSDLCILYFLILDRKVGKEIPKSFADLVLFH